MPRLFVALELPMDTKAALLRYRPVDSRGVRRVSPDQMHVTLHFIGEAEIAQIVALLTPVAMQACSMTIKGVGQFSRGAVLWAGVRLAPPLSALHAAIARALTAGSVAVESRPYRPHVTLARCKPQAPRAVIDDFLARGASLQLPDIPVGAFALYSSTAAASGGPLYRVERRFAALP